MGTEKDFTNNALTKFKGIKPTEKQKEFLELMDLLHRKIYGGKNEKKTVE